MASVLSLLSVWQPSLLEVVVLEHQEQVQLVHGDALHAYEYTQGN